MSVAVWPQIEVRYFCHYKTLIWLHIKSMNIVSLAMMTMIWLHLVMVNDGIADIECVISS